MLLSVTLCVQGVDYVGRATLVLHFILHGVDMMAWFSWLASLIKCCMLCRGAGGERFVGEVQQPPSCLGFYYMMLWQGLRPLIVFAV